MFSSAFTAVGVTPTLGALLILYVACVGVQGLFQRWSAELGQRLHRDVVAAVRERAYRAIVGMTWTGFTRTRQSDHMQILTHDVERVGAAAHVLVDLLVMALTAAVYVALAVRISPAMTALVALCGAALAALTRAPIARARRDGQRFTAVTSRLYAAIAEHLSALKLVRSFGREQRHADAFAAISSELGDAELEAARTQARLRSHLLLASSVVLAAVVYTAHALLRVPAASLLLLLFLFGRLIPRLTGMSEKVQLLATLLPAYDAVRNAERQCLVAAERQIDGGALVEFSRQIAIEHISFAYRDDADAPALLDVSLVLAAGATTAIVGSSGSGKSTLADVLMGLIEPERGRILIDGVPLDRGMLTSWRAHIGYVPQEAFLLHDTVRANLMWARPDATEAQLWHALELAAADVFVRNLPEGLDTMMGDRGVLVSGGERQRLSLARALVREPKILILDEATSALDSENDARIRQALDRLHRQMTIVLITHRLATTRDADTIHVMEHGRIVESGTWSSLMTRSTSRFRILCEAQEVDVAVIR
jgi:ATP-binding cassette subfamily C protein